MPFKPFVLMAGVADVAPLTFIGAVIAGRGFRYGAEAILALLYGDQAMAFVSKNVFRVSIGAAALVAVVAIVVAMRRRRAA